MDKLIETRSRQERFFWNHLLKIGGFRAKIIDENYLSNILKYWISLAINIINFEANILEFEVK